MVRRGALKPANLDQLAGTIQRSSDDGEACRKLIDAAATVETNIPDKLLTIDGAASLLGVTPQTLRNWEKDGLISPQSHTPKGHRRYTKSQIMNIKKQQMEDMEILLPDVTPTFLIEMVQKLVQTFDPLEQVNLVIKYDTVLRKLRFVVDSVDGLNTVSRSFNMKE